MFGILVFGASRVQAAVADLPPSIDFPSIHVQHRCPACHSPETMAPRSPFRWKKQFTSIAGVHRASIPPSTQGGTDITIQFDINKNIDTADQDVQSMIGRA